MARNRIGVRDHDQDWRGSRKAREGRKGMRRHACLLSNVGAALRRDPMKELHPNRGKNPLLQLKTITLFSHFLIRIKITITIKIESHCLPIHHSPLEGESARQVRQPAIAPVGGGRQPFNRLTKNFLSTRQPPYRSIPNS